jgi:hypothetical protein
VRRDPPQRKQRDDGHHADQRARPLARNAVARDSAQRRRRRGFLGGRVGTTAAGAVEPAAVGAAGSETLMGQEPQPYSVRSE